MNDKRPSKVLTLAVSLLLLLSGCSGSVKNVKIAGKFGNALANQPITSATAEVSCDVILREQEEEEILGFRTVVNSKADWNGQRTYSDITSSMDGFGSQIIQTMQCYGDLRDGDMARYVHVDNADLWLRLETQKRISDVDPRLIMGLLETVSQNTEMEIRENPGSGSTHYVLRLTFHGSDILEFAENADMRLSPEMKAVDLSGVTLPVEVELEDKTFLPVKVLIQLKGINRSLINVLADAFAKGNEVRGLNVEIGEISLLITHFGYEPQNVPMLPMGAAENALDMRKVKEIQNH